MNVKKQKTEKTLEQTGTSGHISSFIGQIFWHMEALLVKLGGKNNMIRNDISRVYMPITCQLQHRGVLVQTNRHAHPRETIQNVTDHTRR